MNKYKHAGNVIKFACEVWCPLEEVIDLASNINFVQPNLAIDFNSLDISSYPVYDELYHRIADQYEININELEVFNWASVWIFSFFRSLPQRECYIYSPTYLEYKNAAESFWYTYTLIDRRKKHEDPIQTQNKNPLVVFVNPSTPDWKYHDLHDLFEYRKTKNATILIDESFLEFCDKPSFTKHIHEYDNLYILKSMTKFYSSAGIRIGIIISNSENIEKLKSTEPIWKISQFDSHYITHAIADKTFKKKSDQENLLAKKYLEDILESSPFVKKVYPSDANFVLVELDWLPAKKLQKLLRPYKIIIRDCSDFDFLDESYARFAVKKLSHLEVLAKALVEIEIEIQTS